jgi:hypothetical protein
LEEEALGQGLEEEEADEETEAVRVKPLPTPLEPTAADIAAHEVTHLPYRSWCPHCVRGKGKSKAHKTLEAERDHLVPTISCDYMFLGDEESTLPIIVHRVHGTKWVSASVVPSKGPEAYAVKVVTDSIKRLGYKRFLYKSDQEPALLALKAAAMTELGDAFNIKPELAQLHDQGGGSQSNAHVERAVQEVGGQTRSLKDALEFRYGPVDSKSDILPWLVMYSAALLSKFQLGVDGKTAFQREYGKECKQVLPVFGECVHFMPLGKRGKLMKLLPRWTEGIYLGTREGSNELYIGTEKGVCRAVSVKQQPQAMRFNKEIFNKMKGTPWAPTPGNPSEEVPERAGLVIGRSCDDILTMPIPRAEGPQVPRRVYIRSRVELAKFGFTANCDGCDAAQRGSKPVAHNDACRRRIEAKIDEDAAAEGTASRAAAAEQRREQFVSDYDGDRKRARAASKADADMGTPAAVAPSTVPPNKRGRDEAATTADDLRLEAESSSSAPASSASAPSAPAAVAADDVVMSLEEPEARRAQLLMNSLGARVSSTAEVVEVFNPGRFGPWCSRYGLTRSHAFDLTLCDPEDGLPWDLNCPIKRAKVESIILDEEPMILIGSPTCRAFSQLIELSRNRVDPGKLAALTAECVEHLKFSFHLYNLQAAGKRYFLHEQPYGAWSWSFDFVKELREMPGVHFVRGVQCGFGQWSRDVHGEGLVLKPTGWLTNSSEVAERVGVECSNKTAPSATPHRHIHLVNGKASAAEVYPQALVLAILEGFAAQLRRDGTTEARCIGLITECDLVQEADVDWSAEEGWSHIDDVSGKPLNSERVTLARSDELAYIRKMGVYRKVPLADCFAATGRWPIKVKWIDINKGDEQQELYRSRLVAQELRSHEWRDDVFAATPPLESLKYMFSLAVTELEGDPAVALYRPPDRTYYYYHPKDDDDIVIALFDVSRAHFHSPSRREVYVELCTEDWEADKCALLLKSMYGTRDAAANWESFYTAVLVKAQFVPGAFSPCLFFHKDRQIKVWVHGDDFVPRGRRADVAWLFNILKESLEIRVIGILGPRSDDCKEIKILNRIVRWQEVNGESTIEYEVDPRHVQILCASLGITSESKSVVTPGVKQPLRDRDPELGAADRTLFRSGTMRCNYIAPDRPELLYAAKELARRMSAPCVSDLEALKRMARFLKGTPRVVQVFRHQRQVSGFDGFSDTDHAGCLRTRKSTSGGALMHGHNCLKAYSSTQSVLGLSTGESEFYGMVKMGAVLLGARSMAADLGEYNQELKLRADATAGIGMAKRRGVGKVRHLHTQTLWLQGKVLAKELQVLKEAGDTNASDLCTKHLASELMLRHLTRLGFEVRTGKSNLALSA